LHAKGVTCPAQGETKPATVHPLVSLELRLLFATCYLQLATHEMPKSQKRNGQETVHDDDDQQTHASGKRSRRVMAGSQQQAQHKRKVRSSKLASRSTIGDGSAVSSGPTQRDMMLLMEAAEEIAMEDAEGSPNQPSQQGAGDEAEDFQPVLAGDAHYYDEAAVLDRDGSDDEQVAAHIRPEGRSHIVPTTFWSTPIRSYTGKGAMRWADFSHNFSSERSDTKTLFWRFGFFKTFTLTPRLLRLSCHQ